MKTTDRPQYITQLNAFHRFLQTQYLPPNARLLWFMLIDLFNKSDWAQWVCIDTMRLMTLIGAQSDKTAFRARKQLVDAGLLVYEKGKKAQPSRYHLVWFLRKNDGETDGVSDGESVRDATEKTTGAHTLNTRKEQDETRENNKGVPAELREVWSAYDEMRKKLRKPLTTAASQLVLRTLDTLAPERPDEQKRILEQSILNGWAGVYPLKKEEAPEPPASYDVEEIERKLLYGKIEYKKRTDC